MLDRFNPDDLLNLDTLTSDRSGVDARSGADNAGAGAGETDARAYAHTSEKSREDRLQKREGKSATRTVKQAIAMKHSKVLKNPHD